MNIYLFGWDYDQWAQAISAIGIDDSSIKSAIRVKIEYLRRYGCAPGGVHFVGIEPKKDYSAADKLFAYPYWSVEA